MEENTKDIHQSIIAKITKDFKLEDVLVYITIFTTATTVFSFALRGLWYSYQCGYFHALNIDMSYLKMDETFSLYAVLGFIVIMLLFLGTNIVAYWCVANKRSLWFIGPLILETVIFFFYVSMMTQTDGLEIMTDIIQNRQGKAYLGLVIRVIILFILVNLYGMVYGIFQRIWKLPKQHNVRFLPQNEKDIKAILIYFSVIFVFTISYAWWIGVSNGNNKTDFKVTIMRSDSLEENVLEDKYIFNGSEENVLYNLYAVLYENEESYLLAYMYYDKSQLHIDKEKQKVIGKEAVVTIYKDLIELNKNSNQSERETSSDSVAENSGNIVNEQGDSNTENRNMEIVFAIIIGVVLGGGISYFSWERTRKKVNRNVQGHAASMLYYDLKSIEQYLKEERRLVNIRYSKGWQNMVMKCSFLDDNSVAYLYRVYQEVYNYNTSFKQRLKSKDKFKKEKLNSYEKIRELLWNSLITDESYIYNDTYIKILNELQRVKDRK